MNRKRVLILADYYVPGYMAGGPIRSLQSVCDALGREFDIYLVTRDRDLGGEARYKNIIINSWMDVGSVKVMYVESASFSFGFVNEILRKLEPDVVHLNSLMSIRFSFIPLLTSRYSKYFKGVIFLSPRGELSRGALKIGGLKKRVYLFVIKLLNLDNYVEWIASSDGEKSDILHNFGTSKLVINRINNLPNFSQWKSKIERTVIKTPNEINLVFFSRISPMKNLHYLLDILSEIDINVNLDVYGPKEDLNYLNSCENKISVLPNNVKVNLLGTLSPENAYSVMKEYDLFVLPTLGENFGQAIWEALASSLPILISDRTPWKNLEKIGVGWEVSLEKPSHFLRIIKKVYSMDEHEHRILRDKSRKFALDYVESSDSLHKLRIIYSR